MNQKSELGKLGEDLACEYLKRLKYKIINRNFKRSWGELDVVAIAPDKTLVFVEVKTMGVGFDKINSEKSPPALTHGFGGLKPENQMTAAKLKKFKKAAYLYAGHNQHFIKDKKGWRLDLIAIEIKGFNELNKPIYQIRHYENIE